MCRVSIKLDKVSQQFVVQRLKVMYGDSPPADPVSVALVKLSMARLKALVFRQQKERSETRSEKRSA